MPNGKSLRIALWLNGAPAIDFVSPPDNKKLIETLNKLRFEHLKTCPT
jgi:hypothetical protein